MKTLLSIVLTLLIVAFGYYKYTHGLQKRPGALAGNSIPDFSNARGPAEVLERSKMILEDASKKTQDRLDKMVDDVGE